MADFWVIGPIAWDRVLRMPGLPVSGGFVQAIEVAERPGGAGANVAIALASTGTAVHMVGYVGDDEAGTRMRSVLGEARVDTAFVHARRGHTSEVDILIEPSGERTMIGIWPDLLHTVRSRWSRPGTWPTSPPGTRNSCLQCGSSATRERLSPQYRRHGLVPACPPCT